MPTSSKNGPRSRGRAGAKFLNNRRRLEKNNRICHICGTFIPFGYTWPHELSWTADHIIPDSQIEDFDDPLHWSLDNLAPAHAGCNRKRGVGKAPKSRHPQSRAWLEDEC